MKTWKMEIFARISILRSGRGTPVRQCVKSHPNNGRLHTGATPRIKYSRLQAALATLGASRGHGSAQKQQKDLSIPSPDKAARIHPKRPDKMNWQKEETAELDWSRPAASLPQCSRIFPFRSSRSPGSIFPCLGMFRRKWQNRQCGPHFPRSMSAWERLPPG